MLEDELVLIERAILRLREVAAENRAAAEKNYQDAEKFYEKMREWRSKYNNLLLCRTYSASEAGDHALALVGAAAVRFVSAQNRVKERRETMGTAPCGSGFLPLAGDLAQSLIDQGRDATKLVEAVYAYLRERES
jgi:hypothetical protein